MRHQNGFTRISQRWGGRMLEGAKPSQQPSSFRSNFKEIRGYLLHGETNLEILNHIKRRREHYFKEIKRAEIDRNQAELVALGINPESAMDFEGIAEAIIIYEKLQKEYAEVFRQKGGTDAVIHELVNFIVGVVQDPLAPTSYALR